MENNTEPTSYLNGLYREDPSAVTRHISSMLELTADLMHQYTGDLFRKKYLPGITANFPSKPKNEAILMVKDFDKAWDSVPRPLHQSPHGDLEQMLLYARDLSCGSIALTNGAEFFLPDVIGTSWMPFLAYQCIDEDHKTICKNATSGKPRIHKMLTISVKHVQAPAVHSFWDIMGRPLSATKAWSMDNGWHIITAMDSGWLIGIDRPGITDYIFNDSKDSRNKVNKNVAKNGLGNCFALAENFGCDLLYLRGDGHIVPYVKLYDGSRSDEDDFPDPDA